MLSEEWLADHNAKVARWRGETIPAPHPHTRSGFVTDTITRQIEPITLHLSVPPSVNEMFANVPGKGRVKSSYYRKWRKVAKDEALPGMAGKRRINGLFRATIWVTLNFGGDLDNRIKATLDLCKTVGAIKDDKGLVALHAYRCHGKNGLRITLEPATEADIKPMVLL